MAIERMTLTMRLHEPGALAAAEHRLDLLRRTRHAQIQARIFAIIARDYYGRGKFDKARRHQAAAAERYRWARKLLSVAQSDALRALNIVGKVKG